MARASSLTNPYNTIEFEWYGPKRTVGGRLPSGVNV
jgi:hypothetical protein